jgi:FkbM family methyltransferase
MIGSKALKRWRENYYLSRMLTGIAKPVHWFCHEVSSQIAMKVKTNGVAVSLPNGRTLRIARDSGVGIASLLLWGGLDGYEPETSKTLRFFFERATTFVDVGANYGFYSLLGALWNPNLRVVAFEPVPDIYSALTRNIALNGLEGRVTAYQIALADRSGRASFYLPASESKDCEATGTLVNDGWQSRKQSPKIEVQTARFDDHEKSHPMKVDLVKIDVEDFEAGVLTGMQDCIRRDRPFIVCEILPREHGNEKTRKIVESLGYTAYWITSSGYIRVSRFDFDRTGSQDFLLSPVSVPGEVVNNLELFLQVRRHQ